MRVLRRVAAGFLIAATVLVGRAVPGERQLQVPV